MLERWDPERVVDGEGRFAYPGFMDPHSHFTGYGLSLDNADLNGAGTWEEVVARVQARQRRQPTPWAQGRGWDHTRWPGRAYPTRDLLDQAFPDQPALLVRTDGHAAVVNGAALALAGVDTGTRIDGGEFVQAGGRLTGLLIDNAIDRVRQALPIPGREDQVRALLAAQANCFAMGLTSVCDAGIACSLAQLMDELHRSGRLKIRIYAMLDPTEENYEHFLSQGPYLTDRLTVRSVKTYADGALGSRGALLLEPYQDDPGNRGLQLNSDRQLEEIDLPGLLRPDRPGRPGRRRILRRFQRPRPAGQGRRGAGGPGRPHLRGRPGAEVLPLEEGPPGPVPGHAAAGRNVPSAPRAMCVRLLDPAGLPARGQLQHGRAAGLRQPRRAGR